MDGSEKEATDKRRKIKEDGKAGGKRWKRIEVQHEERYDVKDVVRTRGEGRRERERDRHRESERN